MSTIFSLQKNGFHLFQHKGKNALKQPVEITLILVFLDENSVFKIEAPEILEIEIDGLREDLSDLREVNLEDYEEDTIGQYTIDKNWITIKFKNLELEGVLIQTGMLMNIDVSYVDWIKGDLIKQRAFENVELKFISS